MKYSKCFLTLLAGGWLSLSCAGAVAQERSPQIWLNAGLLSYHFDRSKNYNETNLGLGAEALLAPDHAVMAGFYKNSEREHSRYLGYQWRPLHWQPGGVRVSAGVGISAIDGYPTMSNRGWFLAPMPMLAIEGEKLGANLIIVPNVKHGGAVAVQLKLRVW
jgi:hypothetical protein